MGGGQGTCYDRSGRVLHDQGWEAEVEMRELAWQVAWRDHDHQKEGERRWLGKAIRVRVGNHRQDQLQSRVDRL